MTACLTTLTACLTTLMACLTTLTSCCGTDSFDARAETWIYGRKHPFDAFRYQGFRGTDTVVVFVDVLPDASAHTTVIV